MSSKKYYQPKLPHVGVPYARGSETSFEAAASIKPHLGELQAKVLTCIRMAGAAGMTCDEVEVALDGRHQTISARVNELMEKGLILKQGKRRTRSGRQAQVWVTRENLK